TSLPGVPACEGNVRGCSTSTTGAAVSDTCEATGRSGAQAASNIPNEAATMAAALLIQTFLKNKKATGQTYAFRTKLQARLVCMQQTVATRQHFLADQINRPAWRACFWCFNEPGGRSLDSVLVLVGAGVDLDLVTDLDEGRHHQLEAGADRGRLEDLARGVALDGGFSVGDFTHDGIGEFDRDGLAVVEHHFALQTIFE